MNNFKHSRAATGPRHICGISLVELMVSLVLGLLVVGAAISVFASNRQTYRATESLGRVQENARVAFELMARDVREAAGNPCGNSLPVSNVINDFASRWWTDWGTGIRAVDDADPDNPANRVANTDAVDLMSGDGMGAAVVSHDGATFHLNTTEHGFEADDVLMVCDNRQAAVFQMTGPNAANATVVHNQGGGTVGNCTLQLNVPLDCSATGVAGAYKFSTNSLIVKLRAVRWYVGTNGRGGNSLYRMVLRNGAVDAANPEEITDGVENMQITYLLPGETSYVNAATVGVRWNEVLAARIDVTLEGDDRVGPNGELIERQLVHVATLRNRNK